MYAHMYITYICISTCIVYIHKYIHTAYGIHISQLVRICGDFISFVTRHYSLTDQARVFVFKALPNI